MVFIPGILISVVTFPGVIVHELAHQLFCRLFRVPVFDVCYFRFGNPCGYVSHERTKDPLVTFMISMGPFFVNTVVGMIILAPAAVELVKFGSFSNILNLLLGWIGFSIVMNAFPSTGDAKVMVDSILKNKEVSVVWKILAAPFIGLCYIMAIGSVAWLDFFYAVLVAMIIPDLFVGLF